MYICHNLWFVVKHLPEIINQHSDWLSRIIPRYEWPLHPIPFQPLGKYWGPHSVDHFASNQNIQLPTYNSYNVPSRPIEQWHGRINPLFHMLSTVMNIIQIRMALPTVIALWWPYQPWACRMYWLSVPPPIALPNIRRTFWGMGTRPEPMHNTNCKLYAWRLYGGKI